MIGAIPLGQEPPKVSTPFLPGSDDDDDDEVMIQKFSSNLLKLQYLVIDGLYIYVNQPK